MGDFPFIDVPLSGGGMVIAMIAMFHVVLAHYAVGTGIMLYGFERADPDGTNAGIQRVLQLLGLSVIYINFVVGAISGVGIWFAISLFSPDATQHLIQRFVWLWATEWCMFVVEIILGYVYYYRRRSLPGAARRKLAFLYMASAWGSLLVITGILSYMLTSQPGNALIAWHNPSVWPSVAMRTLSSLALSCLTVALLVNIKPLFPFGQDCPERHGVFQVLYRYLRWFFLLLPFAIWYRLSVPGSHAAYAEGSSIPISMFLLGTGVFSAAITLVAFYAYSRKHVLHFEGAALLLMLGVFATFTAEFVREGIRKPYIIFPILYSNGIYADDIDEWQRQAAAAGSVLKVNRLYPGTEQAYTAGTWQMPSSADYSETAPAQRGEYIWKSQCMICHTRYGFNPMSELTRAWDEDEAYAAGVIRTLHISRPYMPPFVGTGQDIDDLIAFLRRIRDDEEHGHGNR